MAQLRISVPIDPIKLSKEKWSKMAMVPDKGGRLFALLPGNKLAMYEVPRYAKIDFERMRKMGSPAFAFGMNIDQRTVDSEDVLRKILAGK